jgi:hypothetical protein
VATLLIYLNDGNISKTAVTADTAEGQGQVPGGVDDQDAAAGQVRCKGGETNFPIAQLPAVAAEKFNADAASGVVYHGRRKSEFFFPAKDGGHVVGSSKKEKLGCFSGMSITPQRGDALLFYNMYSTEEGTMKTDIESFHAGCDVTEGEKWAANLW